MGTFNAAVIPASTGLQLGNSSQRWAAYLQSLDLLGGSSLLGIQYPATGADIGLTIATAIAALPASGGIVDASNLLGQQTFSSNITLGSSTKPVTLIVPQGAQWSGPGQVAIAGHNSGIEVRASAVEHIDFDQLATPHWKYTATSGKFITVAGNVRGAFVRGLQARGPNSGTATGLYASGNSSLGTAITGLDLSRSNFDQFNIGIALDQSVYLFSWYSASATRCLTYGLEVTSSNSAIGDTVNQAWLYGCNFSGNKVQIHTETPDAGAVEMYFMGGTIADTLAGTSAANGVEATGVGGGASIGGSANLHFHGTHFENLGGSSDGGTPDLTNAAIYIAVNGVCDFVSCDLFTGSAHPHNAIALGAGVTNVQLVMGPNNRLGAGYATELDTASATLASGLVTVRDTNALSQYQLGSNTNFFNWQGGQVIKINSGLGIIFGADNTYNIGQPGSSPSIIYGHVVQPTAKITQIELAAPSGVASSDVLWADSTAHRWKMNNNNGGAVAVAAVVASGTATLTTAPIGSGAVGTTVTVAATGVAATDAISWAYNAAPAANPAELVVSAWPTANNVNFQYANPSAGSITPNAATLNWLVVR